MNGQRNSKDAYVAYAKQILKEHPEYWSKYANRVSHYQIFHKEGTKVVEILSYPRYMAVVKEYFKNAKHYVIEGKSLVLGNNLGRIAGRRVERNFANKQVNWKASEEKWEKTGVRKGPVYFTDDEWVRIGWTKTGKLKNRFLYRFSPAEGNSTGQGFKLEFTNANMENPFLKQRYEYFPYIQNED